MLNIRPVSDLRNKFPEIEETVLRSGEPVFLTKNGYGSIHAPCRCMCAILPKRCSAGSGGVSVNAKKYKLRYLPLFEYDLNEIVDYIAVHLKNPDAAERLVSDMESAIHCFYTGRP